MLLSEIKLNERNPRKITKAKLDKLKKSIADFVKMMELRPIVVDENNVVLGGNMRCQALKALGYEELPDAWVKKAADLTDEEKRRFVVADNLGFGDWDEDVLFEDYNAEELEEWGYDGEFKAKGGKVDEDEFDVPDEVETDIVLGDLFEIGEHRLLCGDSTKLHDVELLLNGLKSDLIFTDPPFDLEDTYSTHIFNSAKEDSHIFIMNSDRLLIDNVNNGINYFRKFFAVDFRQARLISNNQPMTRVDLVAEFCKGKTKFNNLFDGFSTLIECAKIHNENDSINFGHKQAKRLELPAKFIEHYSNKKELIVDFFGGSGSTMAAAQQLDRRCYMIEFDPKNCQIILDRMKKCYNLVANKLR